MKKATTYVIMLIGLAIALSCNNSGTSGGLTTTDSSGYSGPPYTIQLQEYVNSSLPDLHSYTHAIYMDTIIMIGGRTNGLHGDGYNFYQSETNKTVYIIATNGWSTPDKWTVSSMPESKIKVAGVNTNQFRSNNAQFFTEGSVLYIVGGLLGANVPTRLKDPKNPNGGLELVAGAKSADGAPPTGPITLPYMTAVNLPDLIRFVTKGTALSSTSLRQVQNDSLAVTGGELEVMNNVVNLVFGWDFSFSGDLYTHQIRTFTYTDDGKSLSISPITVCKTCWDNQPDSSDSGYYRRRDGSISPMLDPADSTPALVYYAGVFKNGNTNFDNPVWIGSNSAAEQPFVMRSNVYTCQVVPVYSGSRKQSYATMLGGMRNATYNGGAITKPVELTATNAPVTSVPGDFSTIPFSNQITTLMVDSKHSIKQYLLPDSFPPTISPLVLPPSPKDSVGKQILPAGSITYNGAEAELLWTLSSSNGLLSNGVVDYDAFIKANPGGGSIGYIHGGIASTLLNVFGNKAQHYSVASNRIFAVKIVPVK